MLRNTLLETACFAPVSSKEFLDIQATIECLRTKWLWVRVQLQSLKITSVSKNSKKLPKDETEEDVELTTHKKKVHISRRKITNY